LKGLVDTGPLMLQTRVLCVRCATSYEAALALDGTMETFLPSSNGHSQVGGDVDWHLLETESLMDEPLEFPSPVRLPGPAAHTEYVLEELRLTSPFMQDAGLPEMSLAPAQAESTEEEILSPAEDEESLSVLPEETLWPYEERALPYEVEASTLSETEVSERVETDIASESGVESESEPEVSTLSLVSPSVSSSSLFSSSSFEAEVLPASETESERHDSAQAAGSAVVTEEQPVGFVHTAKDALPDADKYSLGVRLMRVSPVWLVCSGLLFISLIFAFNWATKPNAQANNLTSDHSLTESAANTGTQQTASNAPAQAAEQAKVETDRNHSMDANAASTVNVASSMNAAPSITSAEVNDSPAANSALEVKTSQLERGSGNFTVQVGSYSDGAQAQERAVGLKSAGFDARVLSIQLPRRGTWYRVQAGRFGTREEAARYALQLREKKLAAESIITEIQDQ
jgi:cell division septation protein DedD